MEEQKVKDLRFKHVRNNIYDKIETCFMLFFLGNSVDGAAKSEGIITVKLQHP